MFFHAPLEKHHRNRFHFCASLDVIAALFSAQQFADVEMGARCTGVRILSSLSEKDSTRTAISFSVDSERAIDSGR